MKMAGLVFVCMVAVMAAPSLAASNGDPLGPARDGKKQCYLPNEKLKTCYSIAGYTYKSDGTIANDATVFVAPNPLITMKTVSSVVVRDGAVCGKIHKEDIDAAVFTNSGQPMAEAQAAQLRARIDQAFAPMFGKEICTLYVPDGDGLKAEASIDGTPQPNYDQHVIWIGPDDGYTIGPPPQPANP